MFFTIPIRKRSAHVSMQYQQYQQYQPSNFFVQNKQSTLQNKNVTVRSINTPLSLPDKTISRQRMNLQFQFNTYVAKTNSKQRVANTIVVGYQQPQQKYQNMSNLFPVTNNNMTLEKMPILNAGKRTYVSNNVQINTKPKQTFIPTWERNLKQEINKQEIKNEKKQAFVEKEKKIEAVKNPNINVIVDMEINKTPVPWKPSWER